MRVARLGLVLATTMAMFVVVAPTLPAGASTGNAWQLGYSAPGAPDLAWISCPSVQQCVAVGGGFWGDSGSIFLTTDGGRNWAREAVPAGVGNLHDVSCASTAFCMALSSWEVGDAPIEYTEALTSTDGGVAWTIAGQTSGWLSGLTCTSATECAAVVDDGWQYVGDVARTEDGGSSWSFQSRPGTHQFDAPSCPTATVCYLIAQQGDGGQLVRQQGAGRFVVVGSRALPSALTAVSCATSSACYVLATTASGEQLFGTRDGGVSWSEGRLPAGLATGVSLSCPSVAFCSLVTTTSSPMGPLRVATTLDGGRDWTTALLAAQSTGVGTLSCAVISSCYAAGFQVPATTSSAVAGLDATVYHRLGARAGWTASTAPGSETPLVTVACAPPSTCVALGAGTADRSTDGGGSWTPATTPPPAWAWFDEVACATATDCLASGTEDGNYDQVVLYGTTDGGSTWAALPAPPLPQVAHGADIMLDALACPSSSTCLALTNYAFILETTDDGRSWSVVETPPPVAAADHAYALVCPTSTDCLATATFGSENVVLTSTDGGSTWSQQASNGPAIVNLSCASADTCWGTALYDVLGQQDYTYLEKTTDGGATWTQLSAMPGGSEDLGRIWCSASSCEELQDGQLLSSTDDGATWSTDTIPPAMTGVIGLLPPTSPGSPWVAVGGNDLDGPAIATLP